MDVSTAFLLPVSLLIFLIPGFLLYCAFHNKKLKLGFLETVLSILLGNIILSGWLGLILAELGFFSIPNLTVLLLLVSIPLAIKSYGRFDTNLFQKPALTSTSILLIILLLLASSLFLKPYEWIVGGRDQGVYVNTGANIAKTGSVVINDPILSDMNDSSRDVFYIMEKRVEILNKSYHQGLQYLGFYITDKDRGEITPQFLYLYPTWIAILYSLFGLESSLYITPIFAILAVLSVFFLIKLLFNDKVALLSTFLLILNFAEIWYAREPSTEVFTQLLTFSGLALFILFNRTHNKYFGIISAMCLGGIFLTRIDAFLLAAPLFLFFVYLRIKEKLKMEYLYFIIPFSVLFISAFLTALAVSTPYTYDIFRVTFSYESALIEQPHLFAILILLTFLILFVFDFFRSQISKKLKGFRKLLPYLQYLVAFLIITAILYSFFIRPTEGIVDTYNMVKISWYVAGPIGIILAVCGSILLLYKKPYNETYLFLGVMLIYSVYFIANAKMYADQPWWIRRFVPVVIPFILVCIAYLAESVSKLSFKEKPLGKIIFWILLGILTLLSIQPNYPLLNHVEYEGMINYIQGISNSTENNSILVFDKYNWQSLKLSAPLNYIFDRKSLIVYNHNYSAIGNQFKKWQSEDHKIYVLNPSDNLADKLINFGLFLNYKESKGIEVPLMGEGTQYGFPQNITQRKISYDLFEVTSSDVALQEGEITIHFCPSHYPYITGFFSCETSSDGREFRWTMKNAHITFPTPADSDYTLRIRIDNSKKPLNAPMNISVYFNKCLLSSNLTDGDNILQISAECTTGPYSELLIQSEPWIPEKFIKNGDMRELGTIIEEISIKKSP
ncbi:MAG: glycosyltransferase family 39 protein [Candidatus Micrarchaeota archaeon]|nr:glycosyltransferase family 39 protein [Candidatus Micrarchaeota archaeon]